MSKPISIRMAGYGPPSTGFSRRQLRRVHFLPWKGKNYTSNEIRILVLGESHYGDFDESFNFTRRLTRKIISGEIKGRFWTQIAQTITGKSHRDLDRAYFWNSVAFYNYVQQIVAGTARIAPTPEMFNQSEPAFYEVLDFLKPSHLIASGYRLWYRMPRLANEELNFVVDGKRYQYGEYRRSWGRVLAMCIKHPSTAFSANQWHPPVKKFLETQWPNNLENEL